MTEATKKKSLLSKLLPLVIILGGLAVVGVIYKLPVDKTEPEIVPPPPVNVTVQRVEIISTMPDEFALDAIVEPNRVVNVAAEVEGRIERYGQANKRQLKEGDYVEVGAPLIYLNTDLLQAAYNQAKAQYEFDLRNYGRIEEARQKNVATQKELDKARTNLALSKATLDEVKAKLDRTQIVSPISGVVNSLPVEIGEFVQPGTTCVQIVDTKTVKVVFNISEQDIGYFKVGQKQKIFADHDGETITLEGEITYISEVAEELAHTTRVEILVPNGEDRFHSGQFVKVRLKRQDLKDVIMVPLDAIIPLENGYMVYLVEDGKAQPRKNIQIDILSIKGKRIRVVEGLKGGEELIVRGNWMCGPGQEVNVIREESVQTKQQGN
ncbi:MAG: efflux RND transporter periplasmic adaptor subunit [Actinobacteria bacterium]|nr:efflux RND transporter periplasmic adaptor subunit [Actinomycetota bacterium]